MSRRGTWAGVISLVSFFLWITAMIQAAPPDDHQGRRRAVNAAATVDNSTYIDANTILMFVTNHGNMGRDIDRVFGFGHGTFYPYSSIDRIVNGICTTSPFYGGGLWIAAVDSASHDTLLSVSEYQSEYVPGPISDGTFAPDRPSFHVYKLYADSLADNPNQDYLDWPTEQGAPFEVTVDGDTLPVMQGDQMLWSVYNDTDPMSHIWFMSAPLGIEVQQTVWAYDESGDIAIQPPIDIPAEHTSGTGPVAVSVKAAYLDLLTGHQYQIITDFNTSAGYHWDLFDATLGDSILVDQPMENEISVDGLAIKVTGQGAFEDFEVVANGAGPLDPPEAGAAVFDGFPVPTELDPDGYPTNNQQVGDGTWFIHTSDDGGTCGGGTCGTYGKFLSRTLRDGTNNKYLGDYDYELRFTGSNDDPGVGGGYAIEWYNDQQAFWVPFELWRCPKGTPDDPSDDVRLVAYIIDDGNDNTFNLESWGCILDASHGGDGEHSMSSGDNDPFTDCIYWRMPTDSSAGSAGYDANVASMMAGTYDGTLTAYEVLARTVLVNWNGGTEPPFNQDLPEQGTIFRLVTALPAVGETFTFNAETEPWSSTGPEGLAIYIKYKLLNKGPRVLKGFYISPWLDPDVGDDSDDMVGCDTLDNLFYAYNGDDWDDDYGRRPPAFGVKLLEGPIVASAGDTATVDGNKVPDFRNLGMNSFFRFINGTDPDNIEEAYCYMVGRDAKADCDPYYYNGQEVRYQFSGDPVTGIGDVETLPGDRRMMASFGPFDFRPGDTQQVVLKLAVGQGDNRLSSLASLRGILNDEQGPTPVDPPADPALPTTYSLGQNYPNPFNPSTTIRYALPEKGHARIDIFNLLGQRVATLVNETVPAGENVVVWNGTDDTGARVASGVYFYRLTAGERTMSRKMMLLK